MSSLPPLPQTGSPELEEIDLAVKNATNQSQCLLAGHCMTKEYLNKVKTFIIDMLDDYVEQGKQPEIGEIYSRLKEEMGMSAEAADALIEVGAVPGEYNA